MSSSDWGFQTTNGVVTVRHDAIAIRSTPGQFLAGQTIRWRHGSPVDRLASALVVGVFLSSLVGLAYYLYRMAETGFGRSVLIYAVSAGVVGVSLWQKHGRKTTISRSAIETVEFDPDSRQVTITHTTDDGPLSVFREDVTETKLTVATDDDLRTARETFRLRGIPVEVAPAASDTETTHRIVTENGGYFCERCGALATPNDKICRVCEYALWVETTPAT